MQENLDPKVTKKEIAVATANYVQLSDLTEKDLKSDEFDYVPVRMSIKQTKNGERYTILIILHDPFLKLTLQPGGNFIQADRFNLILLKLGVDLKDKMGREKTEWNLKLPVRFVKGKYKDDSEYLSLQIVFKQYLYDTHFFTSNQTRLLQELESRGHLKPKWVESPIKIDKVDFEGVEFN